MTKDELREYFKTLSDLSYKGLVLSEKFLNQTREDAADKCMDQRRDDADKRRALADKCMDQEREDADKRRALADKCMDQRREDADKRRALADKRMDQRNEDADKRHARFKKFHCILLFIIVLLVAFVGLIAFE